MKNKYLGPIICTFALLQLAGCFGLDGKSSGGGSSSVTMSGVAATGAPVSGGLVQVRGSNGQTVEDTTNSDGSYSADVSALEDPYIVMVTAPSGDKIIAVSSRSALAEGKKINVTPVSHIIAANVLGVANADEAFANFESGSAQFTETKLETEKDALLQKFIDAGLLGDGKVAAANIDLLNGDLAAGTSAGLDGLLDVLQFNNDAAAGIEISLKGAATPLITDKVDAIDPPVVVISGPELVAAAAQLDVIALIRIRMNALAAAYSAKVACNGAPVDDLSACGLDALYNTFLPFFHSAFQEEGSNRTDGIWGWFCRTADDHDAEDRADCLANGEIDFQSVALKDITLISHNAGTNVALISFNFYEDGVLHGSEEMALKLEDGLYRMLGNGRTFKYHIETKSLHETSFDKSIMTAGYQGTDTYSVNLNFYFSNQGSYTFNGDEVFTLAATSGHEIFPNNSASMSLYLVIGPNYNSGSCVAGLAFSTRPDPYKIFNHSNGTSSYADYATACVHNTNPCTCQPAVDSWAYFDSDAAQKVTLTEAQVALMNKVEKITLTGSGVAGDSFSINKPLRINEFNAATYIPSFGTTASGFCKDLTSSSSLNLSVATGTLNYVGIHHGFSEEGNQSSWLNESVNESFWNLDTKSVVFSPEYTDLTSTHDIRYSSLYLSARDEFDRQFERRVMCNGN